MPRVKARYQPKDSFSDSAYPHERDNTIWFTEDPDDFVMIGRKIDDEGRCIRLIILLLPREQIEADMLAAAWSRHLYDRKQISETLYKGHMRALFRPDVPTFCNRAQSMAAVYDDPKSPFSQASDVYLAARVGVLDDTVRDVMHFHIDPASFHHGARFIRALTGGETVYAFDKTGAEIHALCDDSEALESHIDRVPLGALACNYTPHTDVVPERFLLWHSWAFDPSNPGYARDLAVTSRALPTAHGDLPQLVFN